MSDADQDIASDDDSEVLDRSNTVRAAIFGIQDGMVSNIGLIMGVIGADVAPDTVVIAGLAGLVSGSVSMGAGEYVSVRTQREMLEVGRPADDELVSPWRALAASSSSFALGALVPLVSFFFVEGTTAVAIGAALSAGALCTTGALLTRFTERAVWWSAGRMVSIGGTAGIVGFLLGNVVRGLLG